MALEKVVSYRDTTTGHVLSEQKSQFKDWDDEKGYLFRGRKACIRLYDDTIFPSSFTDSDIGKLTRLTSRLYMNSNLLCARTNKGFRPMTLAEIQGFVGLQDRQFRVFLRKVMDYSVIRKAVITIGEDRKEHHYYMNPVYAHCGKWVNVNLYLIFKDQLDPFLSDRAKHYYRDAIYRQVKSDCSIVQEDDF